MATDVAAPPERAPMSNAELLALVHEQLNDADSERQTRLQHAGAGELPRDSQTGATLDLSHANIHTLPVEVLALIKDKVERLALSHNPQISVPREIVQCERLRYLNIRWNQLTHFPEAVLQLSKLEILDLSKNRIDAIPEDIKRLTSLRFLAVSRNRIKRLPLALGEMSSLGKLKFDENPLEFPPPDALKATPDRSASAFEAEREKDVCQRVKRYLRAAAVKEKLRTVSEDDLGENNAETPRPPKRSATGGRFPIRPSISGVENLGDIKADSPSEQPAPPPIPQKSHARGESATGQNIRRPSVAPLPNPGDASRSRSETASSSASLRQRRQGLVPPRRPTGELNSVNEENSRSSQASTIRTTHSRATSSVSTVNSFLAPGNSESSFTALSPADTRTEHHPKLSSLPSIQRSKVPISNTIRASKRLIFVLGQLERPINDVALAIREGTPHRSTLERQLYTAHGHIKELDRLLSRLDGAVEESSKRQLDTTKSILRTAVHSLKSYGAVTAELKRSSEKILKFADSIYVRCLMFQIFGTMMEARNICTALGFKVKDRNETKEATRVSQAWSSKSITPTQPKAPGNRRMAKPPALQAVGSNSALQVMSQPPMPAVPAPMMNRSNTTTSLVSATPRSTESYSNFAPGNTTLSRSSTMRSVTDEVERDEQFDGIFLKLQAACNLAARALPQCQKEFQNRRDLAHNAGQRALAQQWYLALTKCEEVITNNKALKKRLEVVKVNDPGVRHQRDFWQLCDAFVHSWFELASEIKEVSAYRVDISIIKKVMRDVQRQVKDVSKTISNSTLYHHAIGSSARGGMDSTIPPSLASPFPAGWNTAYPPHGSTQSGYMYPMPVPATPLSAALGPAVQAAVAHTPTGPSAPREHFQEPQTARSVRDRNDTPQQGSHYPRKL